MGKTKHTPVKTRASALTGTLHKEKEIQSKSLTMTLDMAHSMEELEQLRKEKEALEARNKQMERILAETRSNQELLDELRQLRQRNSEGANAEISVSQGDNNLQLNRLINSFRLFNTAIDIPTFESDDKTNPNEFLKNIESYFILKNISDEHRLIMLTNAFEGRAKVWFLANKNEFDNYARFKVEFLKEFYSIPVQVKLKTRWLSNRFGSHVETLQTYFLKQVKEAQYFTPKLDPFEINYTVVQQLPMRVREALSTVDYADSNKIAQALVHLDSIHDEKIRDRKRTFNLHDNRVAQTRNVRARYDQRNAFSGSQSRYRNSRADNNYQNVQEAPLYQSASSRGMNVNALNFELRRSLSRETFQLPDTRKPPPSCINNNSSSRNAFRDQRSSNRLN